MYDLKQATARVLNKFFVTCHYTLTPIIHSPVMSAAIVPVVFVRLLETRAHRRIAVIAVI